MIGVRTWCASVVAVSAVVLWLGASAGAAGHERHLGSAGADTAAGCLAHVVGGLSEDWYDYYTPGCTGHDEPELDPVSSAPRSAQNITWRVALPADGTFPVSSVGPTFWFGGTVKDSNPHKIGGEGFLELQFYPDSFIKRVRAERGLLRSSTRPTSTRRARRSGRLRRSRNSTSSSRPRSTACSRTPAATGPFVMHALDIVDVHIWAPSTNAAYQEQVTDETSGRDVERARAHQPEATAR